MKRIKFLPVIACITSLLFMNCRSDEKVNEPQTIIFDTDIGNDIDDALAMAMLYNYQKQGLIRMAGITISKGNPAAVSYTDLLNKQYGCPNIPIGYVGAEGKTPEDGLYLHQTLSYAENGKRFFTDDSLLYKRVPEAYKLQRKLLSEAKDHSVTLIVVGFSTNIAKLLQSGPDEYSKLSGKALVAKKVSKLYMMGGMFGENPFPEYNIVKDIPAAQAVFHDWPTPIIVSGWEVGSALKFPAKSLLQLFPEAWEHPVVNAYFHYQKMPYDRETWDLTSVLDAVESDKNYFEHSAAGKITIDDKGMSHFQAQSNGNHYYLRIAHETSQQMILQRLINAVVGK